MPYKKIFIYLLSACASVFLLAVVFSDRIFINAGAQLEEDKAPITNSQQEEQETEEVSQVKVSYEETVEIQKRLMELGYLTQADFTGEYDANTFWAVMLFQKHNSLSVNGICGDGTKEVLFKEDIKSCSDAEFSLLAPTTQMTFEELVGDNGIYEYPEGYPKAGTYRITVDVAHQVVMVYKKDIHGEYTVPVRYMLCSSGARGRTPLGTFEMKAYRVRFGKFVNDGVYGQYWSQIYKAFYFHTILYSQKDAQTYTTTSYNNLGKAVSHGCVRLTVPDARWIWFNIAPGTICEIRKGDKKDEKTASIREKLVLAKAPSKRPSLEMGKIPYTDNWKIEDVPLEIPFVQGAQD